MISAAGVLFRSKDDRVLLVQRSGVGDHAGEWSVPGGHVEGNEDTVEAALREIGEELGPEALRIAREAKVQQWTRRIADDCEFTTYLCEIDEPFVPVLNEESTAFVWAPLDEYLAMGAEPAPQDATGVMAGAPAAAEAGPPAAVAR